MSSIEHCLPESARPHYIRLRNQYSGEATLSHRTKLLTVREQAAARGVLRSGDQELAEWQLTENLIEELAYGWFKAALETCSLYEISLDQSLCKCIEQGIQHLLEAQYKNALRTHASGVGGRIPLSTRSQLAGRSDGSRSTIFNKIRIDLEKARVQSQRNLEKRIPTASVEGIKLGKNIPRTAVVLNVLIASPSDVSEERDVVTKAIYAWNASHYKQTGIMLNPIRWETHSFPASGDRPQAIVNRQIVHEGDFLVGIFGNRLGTPTGEALSGTIEEIELFRKAGKHVALYFSTADVPRNANREELNALEDYQRERQKDTLYSTFAGTDELFQRVSHHLPLIVDNVYESLRASHQLEGLEEELRSNRERSPQRLSDLAARETSVLTTEKNSRNVDVRDWIGEWKESEQQFRKWENSDVFAELFDGQWNIRSDRDSVARAEIEAICDLAGSRLRNSPGIVLSPTITSKATLREQWLQFLKETEGLNREVEGVGEGGYIEHLARISAIACTKCAAKVFGN